MSNKEDWGDKIIRYILGGKLNVFEYWAAQLLIFVYSLILIGIISIMIRYTNRKIDYLKDPQLNQSYNIINLRMLMCIKVILITSIADYSINLFFIVLTNYCIHQHSDA